MVFRYKWPVFSWVVLLFIVMSCQNQPQVEFKDQGEGSFEGEGGSVMSSEQWENSSKTAEYEFEINADRNSTAILILKDADQEVRLKKTLKGGNNGTRISGVSSVGLPGTWMIKIELKNFDGRGSFSVDPN